MKIQQLPAYDNQDINHVDYRVKAYQVALDALGRVGGTLS